MYIRTSERLGQAIGLGDGPDAKEIRAQQELEERRNGLAREREKEEETRRKTEEKRRRKDFAETVSAIRRELQRAPRDGFPKGTPQRRRLENAFKSISPESFARELLLRLQATSDPLGQLFQRRLSTPLRNYLLGVLCQASDPQLQQCKGLRQGFNEQRKPAPPPPPECPPHRFKTDSRFPNKKIYCRLLPGASIPPYDCRYQCEI